MEESTDIGLQELEDVLAAWQKQDSLPADVGQCTLPRRLRSVRWALIKANQKNTDAARGETFIYLASDIIRKKYDETNKIDAGSPVAERWKVLLHHVVMQRSVKEIADKLGFHERTVYRRLSEGKMLLLAELHAEDARLLDNITYYDEFHDRLSLTGNRIERPQELKNYWTVLSGSSLGSTSRILTITGPPGIGKTTLGLELAKKYEDDRSGGVFWHTFSNKEHSIDDLFLNAAGFFALQGDLRLWYAIQMGMGTGTLHGVFLACAIESDSLLCFDDCQQVRANEIMISLLSRLCDSSCAILLLSRIRLSFGANSSSRILRGMTATQSQSLMHRCGVKLFTASSTFQTLHSKAGGNPQLLILCAYLMRGMSTNLWTSFLARMPEREAVWSYIVRNFIDSLSIGQRETLFSLCFVFNGTGDKYSLAIASGVLSPMEDIQQLIRNNILDELSDGRVQSHQIITDLCKSLGPTHFRLNAQQLRNKHLKVARHEVSKGHLLFAAEHYIAAKSWDSAAMVLRRFMLSNPDENLLHSTIRTLSFSLIERLPTSRSKMSEKSWRWACLFRGIDPAKDSKSGSSWLKKTLRNCSDRELQAAAALELVPLYGKLGRIKEAKKAYESVDWRLLKDKTVQVYALTRLAQAYHSAGHYENAVKYSIKATRSLRPRKDHHIEALSSAYQILGKSLELMTSEYLILWPIIINVYRRRLSMISRIEYKLHRDFWRVLGLIDLGKALYMSSDKSSGVSTISQALHDARQLSGACELQVWALIAHAEVMYADERYREALISLCEIFELSRKYTYFEGLERAKTIASKWLDDIEYHREHTLLDTAITADMTLMKGMLLSLMELIDDSDRALHDSIRLCAQARETQPSNDTIRVLSEIEAEALAWLARHDIRAERFQEAYARAKSAKCLFETVGMTQRAAELSEIIKDVAPPGNDCPL